MSKIEPKILITGTNRGLGKFLSEKFDNVYKFTRKDNPEQMKDMLIGTLNQSYDMIIHCAANVSHYDWDNVPSNFFDDNIKLTSDLVKIPHKKFVYISSIDQKKTSPYGISKRISECIVKDVCDNHLIIRPSGLLGNEMKENTFKRILKNKSIALTGDSVMNYILYDDVLDLINKEKFGIITLCANDDITMSDLVKTLDKDIEFGNINFKIESIKSDYDTKKTSKDNILKFVETTDEE
tara:strand:- start:66 stop:779 length:714 start_codon:yes stop_codon:yes gene_type:complete